MLSTLKLPELGAVLREVKAGVTDGAGEVTGFVRDAVGKAGGGVKKSGRRVGERIKKFLPGRRP